MAGNMRSTLEIILQLNDRGLVAGNAQLKKFDRSVRNMNRSWAKVGNSVGPVLLGMGAAAGVAVGMAVKKTAEFDKQMSAVKAKSGAVGAEFTKLRDAARELGVESGFGATQAAQGMEVLAAAGFKTNDVLAAMPGLMNAARAAGSDFETMADIGISAMSGFGLKAKDMARIGDVLALAANESTSSMNDLGLSLKYVGPIAKTVGLTLEDTGAALALLANNGIKGEMAGTALRAGLVRLAKPPKQAQKALKELGLEVKTANGHFKPMPQLLAEMQKKFDKLTPAQRANAAAAIFGTEAAASWLSLIDSGGAKFDTMASKMDKATGTAERQATIMRDNLAGSWDDLKASLEDLGITVGDAAAPMLRDLASSVKSLADGFNAMSPQSRENVVKTVAAIVGVGGLIYGTAKAVGLARDLAGAWRDTAAAAKAALKWIGLASAAELGGDGVPTPGGKGKKAPRKAKTPKLGAGSRKASGTATGAAVSVATALGVPAAIGAGTAAVLYGMAAAGAKASNAIRQYGRDQQYANSQVKNATGILSRAGATTNVVTRLNQSNAGSIRGVGVSATGATGKVAGLSKALHGIPRRITSTLRIDVQGLDRLANANAMLRTTKGQYYGGRVRAYATGGVVTQPHIGLVGEAGPEAIIPLNNPRRAAQVMDEAGLLGRGQTIIHAPISFGDVKIYDDTDVDSLLIDVQAAVDSQLRAVGA